ncbi:MAG: Terminase [Firmicutes bacterium]|nr:Terminase [Bacillota bacterium]
MSSLKEKYPGSYLLEYYKKTQAGEIIIGQELALCLENLVTDLTDEQYQYDLADPQKRIRFIETQCKHSISPFAGKPFLLELWEKALIEKDRGQGREKH